MKPNETELLFIRHCQSYGNVSLPDAPPHHPDDPPLTPHGLKQADALAHRFARGEVDAIYASTLVRTVQTIYPTAEKLGLRIKLVPELMEFSTGIRMTEPERIYRDFPLAFFRDLDGLDTANETPAHAKARAKKIVDEIVAENGEGKRILIVSHGGYIGYLVRYVLGLDLPEPFQWDLDNCGITSVTLRPGRLPLLNAANDRGHLLAYM